MQKNISWFKYDNSYRKEDNDPQLQCPNCKSYKVTDGRYRKKGALMGGIILICLGIWVPFIGWFIFIPVGLCLLIASLFIKNKMKGTCRNCKFVFDIKDVEET
jgi:hypothetical protein